MKQLNKHALISTMILAGAVGFTSCSSDNDLDQTSTTPEKSEMVKTQFAINIPNAGKVGSRMSDKIVQNGTAFRGMTNIQLLPFALATPGAITQNTETVADNPIILSDISNNDIANNAKVYSDVTIPLGTNAFLFYGEAKKETETETDTENKNNGVIIPNTINKEIAVSDISFSLQPILGTKNVTTKKEQLIVILNGIAKVGNWSTSNGSMQILYQSFISLKAGSSTSIRLTIENLYNELQNYTGNESTLKENLITEIKNYFKPSDTAPYTLEYSTPYADFNKNPYPASLGLPAGSAQVKWSNNTFIYQDDDHNANVTALNDYVYPASLYYMANTSIRVADENKTKDGKYSENDWNSILNLYEKQAGTVTASTKSVVLENKINYAVGRLDVKAKFNSSTVIDNAENPNIITVEDQTFLFKGVLVGAQKDAGWDFKPKGTKDYSIYDDAITENTYITTAYPTDNTFQNHTLVLETGTTENDKNINFAIELLNNGDDFMGKDGIIRKGATFYLLGTLTAKENENNGLVFQQDHITTATVTIHSLKNAYNCIPDLRSPKLELGLSIDLTWQAGLNDDVKID